MFKCIYTPCNNGRYISVKELYDSFKMGVIDISAWLWEQGHFFSNGAEQIMNKY